MKKNLYIIFGLFLIAQNIFAADNGGIRVQVIVSNVCSSMGSGGDGILNSEELTWLVGAGASGVSGSTSCLQWDGDATGGCYNDFNGSVIIDQYFT